MVVKQDTVASVERELLFRGHCEELVRGCIPALLGADGDRGVLVLEDVSPAEQGDVLRGCSRAQAEAVVRALARVHAATWQPSDDQFAAEVPRWRPRPLEPQSWADRRARASERFPDILTVRQRTRLHDIPERVAADAERLRAGTASWIQVDSHLDNVLWRPDGTAVLLDWALAAVGPPAVDLARCLVEGMATPTTTAPLLETYADELRRNGVAAEPAGLRAEMALTLPALVQGAVGWAGREDLALAGRTALVCATFLRSVCAWWSDAD